MSKITRYTQKLFGSTAGPNQIAEFGSLAAGTPNRYSGSTVTPALIQALGNYLSGWEASVEGGFSPAIEDMNSLFYLLSYQTAYLLQQGVPEWDAGTTYYIGSIVQDGSGNIYTSLTNTNLNNVLSSVSNWGLLITSSKSLGTAATQGNVLYSAAVTQTTSSLSYIDVITDTLVVNGLTPVEVRLTADPAAVSYIGVSGGNVTNADVNPTANFRLFDATNSVIIAEYQVYYDLQAPNGTYNTSMFVPSSILYGIYKPAAGTITLKLQMKKGGNAGSAFAEAISVRMVAYQL